MTLRTIILLLACTLLTVALTGCPENDHMISMEEYEARKRVENAQQSLDFIDRSARREIRKQQEDIESVKLLKRDLRTLPGLRTRGSTPDFQHFFGVPFTGEGLAQWLTHRVSRITYRRELPPVPALSHVDGQPRIRWMKIAALNEGNSAIVVTDAYNASLPWVLRIALLIHEAQHSFNGGHVPCPSDHFFVPFRELLICDPDDLGSNVFEAVFIKNALLYAEDAAPPGMDEIEKWVLDKFARIADPKARLIVAEGYPDEIRSKLR